MDRLEMLNKARQLAQDQIEMSSCLSDKRYSELKAGNEEMAIQQLAKEFLENAAFDIDYM